MEQIIYLKLNWSNKEHICKWVVIILLKITAANKVNWDDLNVCYNFKTK